MWKTIQGTNEKYSVSNLGNVKRNEHYTIVKPNKCKKYQTAAFYKERKLKGHVQKDGYVVVKLQLDSGKSVTRKIHRLVAQEFLPNPNNFPCVNHKDEIKDNNCVDNLEWCTVEQNNNYGSRNEKIKNKVGIKVAQYSRDGKLIKIWDSISQASRSFGCETTACISRVCSNQHGRKTYRGYIWKYVDSKIFGEMRMTESKITNKQQLIEYINNCTMDELFIINDIINNKINNHGKEKS